MANNCNCDCGPKKIIKTTFLLRRGTTEAWEAANPVLAYGEPGYEKDTGQLKIGDGVTPWKDLPYIGSGSTPAVINLDNKSITKNSAQEISLFDFENAEAGTMPRKNDSGLLEWIEVPNIEELAELINKVQELEEDVEEINSINTIFGGNADMWGPSGDDSAIEEGKTCRTDDEYFDNVKDAFDSATPGKPLEIYLIQDERGAGLGLLNASGDNEKEIIIDLNGYTYETIGPAVGSTGTKNQAMHIEKGNKVTLRNGTFKAAPKAESGVLMLIQNYGDLTLENMTLDCGDNNDILYMCSNNFGTCTIKNSTIIAPEGKVAVDCWFGLSAVYYDGVSVNITDSTISGTIEYGAQRAALSRPGNETWWEKAPLTINNSEFDNIVNSGADSNEHTNITVDGTPYIIGG